MPDPMKYQLAQLFGKTENLLTIYACCIKQNIFAKKFIKFSKKKLSVLFGNPNIKISIRSVKRTFYVMLINILLLGSQLARYFTIGILTGSAILPGMSAQKLNI